MEGKEALDKNAFKIIDIDGGHEKRYNKK